MISSFIVFKMDYSSLDRLLQQRREKAAPTLPGSLSQNVWREIRQRRASREPSANPALFWLWLLRPHAVLALTLAVMVGIGVGSRSPVSPAAQAHEALDLQVFGNAAPALPSTLLAEI